ncbi:MAG: helix-turn-helix transcriptional regulator [Haloarculaceae archaeon]
MEKFLQSGRRRDVCVLLAGAGELTGQKLKTRLERHYDERIEPRSFYGALDALVEAGFLERRTEGVADVYALTEAGEQRLRDHVAWVTEHVD